ncbi:MAG: hypothetical protein ABIR96_05330 [Bdellovibrionota bacterium]
MLAAWFGIFFGTFVLEDAALAAAIVLAAKGEISVPAAFLASFLGISVGDIGLYALGVLLARWGRAQQIGFLVRLRQKLVDLVPVEGMGRAVVVSRILPGARLPTYVGAGFVSYSFARFVVLTLLSVLGWVLVAFAGGRAAESLLSKHWLISVIVLLALLHVIKNILPVVLDPWRRRASYYAWRQWLHFEFWPAWLFYTPVVLYYFVLSLKYRNFLLPFYANPAIPNGGFMGESKWAFLKHLDAREESSLKTLFVAAGMSKEVFKQRLSDEDFSFPFILKPDVGQRGFGVRIIRSDADLAAYLDRCDFDVLVQEFSSENYEAGIFYYRIPSEPKGTIFSITDKDFPEVIGDAKSRLGELILRDPRARVIAGVYFERLKKRLDEIPARGTHVVLSECGNHCQGAIFKNGASLNSPQLVAAIEKISVQIPGFFFGRFDVKYASPELLKQGRGFKIVEVNGLGSEATHIWDPKTPLGEAYRVLFEQWSLLFQIGAVLKNSSEVGPRPKITQILWECLKIGLRKSRLAVSS